MVIVVGITGTNGAGKGTIVEYLQKKGFNHFSARELIYEEIDKRNLPRNRDSLIEVANDLRSKYGPSYVAEQLYARAKLAGGNAVLESLRTPGEINNLRELSGFVMWAVNADRQIRYDRVVARKSETDRISFEEFSMKEDKEMSNDDPNKQNLLKCIDMSDHVFVNEGSIEDFNEQVEKVLENIGV